MVALNSTEYSLNIRQNIETGALFPFLAHPEVRPATDRLLSAVIRAHILQFLSILPFAKIDNLHGCYIIIPTLWNHPES
jgi:hypothetical protein